MIAVILLLGRPYATRICFIISLLTEVNALKNSADNNETSRFFARTPSMIRRIVRFGDILNGLFG